MDSIFGSGSFIYDFVLTLMSHLLTVGLVNGLVGLVENIPSYQKKKKNSIPPSTSGLESQNKVLYERTRPKNRTQKQLLGGERESYNLYFFNERRKKKLNLIFNLYIFS